MSPPASWRILFIRPPNYSHAAALSEMVETVYFGLRALGLKVAHGLDGLRPGEGVIVIGAQTLPAAAMARLPPGAIVYNFEQVQTGSAWMRPEYLGLLAAHEVWDYSRENVRRLAGRGVAHAKHVPVGYVPELSRIAPADEDIDVLFYGSMNPRRQAVIDGLARRGVNVKCLFDVYGAARDAFIARAKIVLNLHYYDAHIFETVRVSYLLANRRAVVAECGRDTEIEDDLRPAIRAASYGDLVDACVELVNDATTRAQLAERGHRIFSARGEAAILAGALNLPRPG